MWWQPCRKVPLIVAGDTTQTRPLIKNALEAERPSGELHFERRGGMAVLAKVSRLRLRRGYCVNVAVAIGSD
jgi:hypothetical protein